MRPLDEVWDGQGGKGFGWGTVHHSAGSLRMPYKPKLDAPFSTSFVVDEDLSVSEVPGLYICDMSVMPFSSAANPVRTLASVKLQYPSATVEAWAEDEHRIGLHPVNRMVWIPKGEQPIAQVNWKFE